MRPIVLLLASCAVAACSAKINVEADWGETMKRYNFIGLYPISEDYQPGDVLLDVPPAPGSDPQPRSQRLGSFAVKDLANALSDQEKRRLYMESFDPDGAVAPAAQPSADKPAATSTVTNTASAQPGATITTTTRVSSAPAEKKAKGNDKGTDKPDPNAPATPAIIASGTVPRQSNAVPRMRRVSLPGIVVARVSDYQISGGAWLGQVGVALGLAGEGSSSVAITLKNLEVLAVDTLAANKLLREHLAEWLQDNQMDAVTLLSQTYSINPGRVGDICRGVGPRGGDDDRAVIRVINRVLYTRDISYEYVRTNTTNGRLAADVAQASAAVAARSPLPSAGSAVQAATLAPITTASGAVNQLNGQSAANQAALLAASPTSPGVRTTVGVGSYGGASLTDHFARPMAVGYNTVHTYAVADVMALTGKTPEESSGQLEAVRKFCAAIAPDKYPVATEVQASGRSACKSGVAPDEHPDTTEAAFTPIEWEVCGNTDILHDAFDTARRIAVPSRCRRILNSTCNVGKPERRLTPFRPLGPQARDNMARG